MALTLDEGDSVDARECERRMKDRQCKREREKMRKSKKKKLKPAVFANRGECSLVCIDFICIIFC